MRNCTTNTQLLCMAVYQGPPDLAGRLVEWITSWKISPLICKTSVFPGYHSVTTPQGQEIPITTFTVQRLGMQTFWRKLASFSDRCAFVLVPQPLDLSSPPAVQLLPQNGGKLKKQDLITCGYKWKFCLRFHSSRLKNTQYLLRNK